MANDKANWQVIDPASLTGDLVDYYAEYKDAYKIMKAMRERFEDELRKALASYTPKGKRIAIAYNFGKLSVAVVDDTERRAPAKSVSLADLVRR